MLVPASRYQLLDEGLRLPRARINAARKAGPGVAGMSLRKAINDKCKSCIYDPLAGGTWRKQVEECTVTLCPLHPVRPKTQAKRKGKGEQPPQLRRYQEKKRANAN